MLEFVHLVLCDLPASPQPHVPGALHDVPDGTAARGLLAPAHLLQEFPAGWR